MATKKSSSKKTTKKTALPEGKQFFNCIITDATRSKLERLCKKRGVKMSECVRQLIAETKA